MSFDHRIYLNLYVFVPTVFPLCVCVCIQSERSFIQPYELTTTFTKRRKKHIRNSFLRSFHLAFSFLVTIFICDPFQLNMNMYVWCVCRIQSPLLLLLLKSLAHHTFSLHTHNVKSTKVKKSWPNQTYIYYIVLFIFFLVFKWLNWAPNVSNICILTMLAQWKRILCIGARLTFY